MGRLKYFFNVALFLFSNSEQLNEGEGDNKDGWIGGKVEKHFLKAQWGEENLFGWEHQDGGRAHGGEEPSDEYDGASRVMMVCFIQ